MDLLRLVFALRILEKLNIPYMVTGSIAAILYGKPRLTHDLDAVVEMFDSSIASFVSHFEHENFYCPPSEVVAKELKHGDQGHFKLIDNESGFKIDIYPHKDDPLVTWALERKKKIELLKSEEVWVAPPEYVILKKLIYFKEGGSEKHLEDIKGMLEVTASKIDQAEIERWVDRLNLTKAWSQINS